MLFVQNKAKALKVLRSRLYEAQREREAAMRATMRKEQVGTGDRSDRIRTYNFPQNRVTDHRVGLTKFGTDAMLAGELMEEFSSALAAQERTEKLAQLEGDDFLA